MAVIPGGVILTIRIPVIPSAAETELVDYTGLCYAVLPSWMKVD